MEGVADLKVAMRIGTLLAFEWQGFSEGSYLSLLSLLWFSNKFQFKIWSIWFLNNTMQNMFNIVKVEIFWHLLVVFNLKNFLTT